MKRSERGKGLMGVERRKQERIVEKINMGCFISYTELEHSGVGWQIRIMRGEFEHSALTYCREM